MKKAEFCEKFSRNLWQRKFNENSRQYILSLNVKSATFSWKNLLNFIKIGEILVKNSEKMWMKSTELALFSRKFKPRYLPVKNENQKNLFNSILYASQPVSTLYDEYIDRPKLTEQKNPFEYIVPAPLKRGRNNKLMFFFTFSTPA